ncbi:MAG: hypothetical protein C0621_03060 [Desulfuromonas sp.]|nr:MAG: hypothetical protein C0621_03060 [Desulfuromonas sp.]
MSLTRTDNSPEIPDQESLLRRLADLSRDAQILHNGEDGACLYANPAARQLFSRLASPLAPTDWVTYTQTLRRHGEIRFRRSVTLRDGGTIRLEIHDFFLATASGGVIASTLRNINHRHRLVSARAAQRQRLEMVLGALDEGITVQNRQLRILYQNPAHIAKQGDHRGDYCYRAYQGLDAPCPGCLVVKSFEDGEAHSRQTQAMTENGTFHMEVLSLPVHTANGEVEAVMEVVRNITPHKLAEESLKETERLRSQFITTAAHELSTPVTAIVGYSELLTAPPQELQLTQEQKEEFSRLIHDKAQFLAETIDKLFDLSRIDRGAPLPLFLTEFDLCTQLSQSLRHVELLFPSHCFTLIIPSNPLYVTADPSQVARLLENLLHNAVLFSANNSEVTLELTPHQDEVVISISDEGCGMNETQRQRAFEPFYRGHTKDTDSGGLGLGLSICHQIITAHSGSIALISEVDAGTQVFVTLPRHTLPPT